MNAVSKQTQVNNHRYQTITNFITTFIILMQVYKLPLSNKCKFITKNASL